MRVGARREAEGVMFTGAVAWGQHLCAHPSLPLVPAEHCRGWKHGEVGVMKICGQLQCTFWSNHSTSLTSFFSSVKWGIILMN